MDESRSVIKFPLIRPVYCHRFPFSFFRVRKLYKIQIGEIKARHDIIIFFLTSKKCEGKGMLAT